MDGQGEGGYGRDRRRVCAVALAVLALGGLALELRQLAHVNRVTFSAPVRASSEASLSQMTCLRDQVEAIPARPTFATAAAGLDAPYWRQRLAEFAFPEVPIVSELAAAEQVATVVEVEPGGPASCSGLRVDVTAP